MSLEEKLKTVVFEFAENKDRRAIDVVSAIKSTCQEAVDEAKIEENRFHQKCFPSSEQQMIFTYQIFEARIKELKEKL